MAQHQPKPGPHLHQPPTLAELAELHARYAHEALTIASDSVDFGDVARTRLAEVHAAVARACAHAAIARRSSGHPRGQVVGRGVR